MIRPCSQAKTTVKVTQQGQKRKANSKCDTPLAASYSFIISISMFVAVWMINPLISGGGGGGGKIIRMNQAGK